MKAYLVEIRPLTESDKPWVQQVMIEEWGSEIVVVHGDIFHPGELPGYLGLFEGKPAGLLTYHIKGKEFEVVTLNSFKPSHGIGNALLESARDRAHEAGCQRMFLVTTNNNQHALDFYQNRGFSICAVRKDAIAESRKIKPEIPQTDAQGHPIRDEIELEILLGKNAPAGRGGNVNPENP